MLHIKSLQTLVMSLNHFFRTTGLLIKKNWANTNNILDIVELIASCGSKEIQNHLIYVSTNATYMSTTYVAKFIYVMYDHTRLPLLLKSLRNS